MEQEYYFYDLETSGLDAKWQRIMQFAGQRTDQDFNPIGEPDNILVKLTPEILPDPEAILVTGITPQQTLESGFSEKDFCDFLMEKVFTDNTTALGYNTIRFDDEFIRYTLFRNFYDPYEREWSNNRKRWDIIDLVRITRALRPEGIEWPELDGKKTLSLEEIAKANKIKHLSAHDALSDVLATIEVAKLVKDKQPKLFEFVKKINDKNELKDLIDFDNLQPFVHCSGMIHSDVLSTSCFVPIASHPRNKNAVIVYDLRYSPKSLKNKSISDLKEMLFSNKRKREAKGIERLPIKLIHLNKSPIVVPIGVLGDESQKRIGLTLNQVMAHRQELTEVIGELKDKIIEMYDQEEFEQPTDVEGQLYSGFINNADKKKMEQIRNMDAEQLSKYSPNFVDERLNQLVLRYKARNYPDILDEKEAIEWNNYVSERLNDAERGLSLKKYFMKIEKLSSEVKDKDKKFLLEELFLFGQSNIPYQQEELL